MKNELSWSWHGEGSRRRGCSTKIKVVKVKIFFCQNHAGGGGGRGGGGRGGGGVVSSSS